MILRLLPAFAALALALPATRPGQGSRQAEPKSASAAAKDYKANSASKTFTGTFGGRR